MIILGIETSCDETSAAVAKGEKNKVEILSNVISSQVKLHAKWGGVVPNLAAREHLKNFVPVLKLALREAKIKVKDIDLISVTNGPGLIPALLIGTTAAKTLAYAWEKPLLGIHHIEGHIYANFINEISVISKSQSRVLGTISPAPLSGGPRQGGGKQILIYKTQKSDLGKNKLNPCISFLPTPSPLVSPTSSPFGRGQGEGDIKFPILCLVVSGGHTQLVLMKNHLKYEIVGQTLDDAAGEAFDKVARILNIGYPGGPAIAEWAVMAESRITNYESSKKTKNDSLIHDSRCKIQLPRPMLNKKNFDFSFSGLKTAVLYETKKHPKLLKNKNYIAEMCREFQQSVVDVLVHKTLKAAEKYRPKTIMLAGGVAANQELRKQLGKAITNNIPDTLYIIPEMRYTGDNAAMIAAAAYFRWKKMTEARKKKVFQNWKTLNTDANLKLK